jgi:tetratricopeptide (TPR) repeat protein
MRVTLLGDDLARMRRGGTNNAEAMDAYLRGVALKHKQDPASARLALAAFDRAVALDPGFALAHVLRARVLSGMAEGFGDASTDVGYLHLLAQQGVQEAELAVQLAPDLAAAHAALGAAAQDFWDFRRASTEFARAAELEPNDAPTLVDYAWMQAYLGHTATAVAAARRAALINPLSQGVYVDLVWTLIWSHKPEEAQQALRRAEQLGAGRLLATYLAGRIALAAGDAAGAQRICAAGEDWKQNYCLAIADHLLGQQEAAAAQLAALRARMGDNAAFQYADIYAQWGQADAALTALETAYRLRDTGMMEIQVDPMLGPIRAMPRFQAVLRSLDFPP